MPDIQNHLFPVLQRTVGWHSDPRNRHHIADGQAIGVNVGYGASISGRPMSASAAKLKFVRPDLHRGLRKSHCGANPFQPQTSHSIRPIGDAPATVKVLFLRLMRSLPLLRSTLAFGVLLRRQLASSRLDGTSNHFGNSTAIHHRESPPLRGLDSVLRYA